MQDSVKLKVTKRGKSQKINEKVKTLQHKYKHFMDE